MSRLMEVLTKFDFVRLLSFGQTNVDFSWYLQRKVKEFLVVALGGGGDN